MPSTVRGANRRNEMTFQQSIKLAQLAKAKGFALRAENGKVQAVTVAYAKNGKSTVTEKSGWMNFDEALVVLS